MDKSNNRKFMVEGAEIKNLMEKEDVQPDKFVVELNNVNHQRLLPGTSVKHNSELPAS